jgi:UDP-N-acetylmuramyl pentapeptide phosphotransferase/UDP-N-acetylglucosamine-1-phosphate transferase
MPELIIFLVTFILSFSLTFLFIRLALKHSILDFPNYRSSHKTPTPIGGGIVIVLTFYSSLSIFYLKGILDKDLFFALLPGLALAAVGVIDDFKGLLPLYRFMVQIICSGIALFFLNGFNSLFGPDMVWLWSFIALFGLVWFINLFNFLDGSDGYASMEAVFVCLALFFFTRSNLFLLLATSVGGLLYWNWPKAKIFMGDSGSTSLGFILMVLGIYFHNNGTISFLFWILLTALFWFDATITLLRRIINKEKLSNPHKNHIYQRAIRGGFSHLKILIWGLGINILLFVCCLIIWRYSIPEFYGFLPLILIMGFEMKYVDNRIPFGSK